MKKNKQNILNNTDRLDYVYLAKEAMDLLEGERNFSKKRFEIYIEDLFAYHYAKLEKHEDGSVEHNELLGKVRKHLREDLSRHTALSKEEIRLFVEETLRNTTNKLLRESQMMSDINITLYEDSPKDYYSAYQRVDTVSFNIH